jgi:hypothetical protein
MRSYQLVDIGCQRDAPLEPVDPSRQGRRFSNGVSSLSVFELFPSPAETRWRRCFQSTRRCMVAWLLLTDFVEKLIVFPAGVLKR